MQMVLRELMSTSKIGNFVVEFHFKTKIGHRLEFTPLVFHALLNMIHSIYCI